jgi:hypothetical protein
MAPHPHLGLQALLNILLNCEGLEIGSTLASFKDFTGAFSPEDRGLPEPFRLDSPLMFWHLFASAPACLIR